MRALGTKNEMFTHARNPLLPPSKGGTKDGAAPGAEGSGGGEEEDATAGVTAGRLEAFPLPWRALEAVAGCADYV